MAKNDNMLAILWMLSSGDKLTAKQISEKLEMNIRTVYRYIDALCASGVPIIADSGHNGGYSLLNQFVQAPLIFDAEEKKALLQAAVFANRAGYPLNEALESATSKLKRYSNQAQESLIQHQLAGFEVINPVGSITTQPILIAIERAVDQETTIEITYRTGRDEGSKNRLINPYGLIYWNNKWYTVAFCHLRNELRSFRVDRILCVQTTSESFNRPEGFSTREFFMKNLLPNLVGNMELIELTVEGRAETLDELCLHWFLGNYLKERTPNQAVFLLDEASAHHYGPYFLLPFGKSLKIIEPKSFKERLVAVTLELMEYYKGE